MMERAGSRQMRRVLWSLVGVAVATATIAPGFQGVLGGRNRGSSNSQRAGVGVRPQRGEGRQGGADAGAGSAAEVERVKAAFGAGTALEAHVGLSETLPDQETQWAYPWFTKEALSQIGFQDLPRTHKGASHVCVHDIVRHHVHEVGMRFTHHSGQAMNATEHSEAVHEKRKRFTQQATWEPIRIRLDTSLITGSDSFRCTSPGQRFSPTAGGFNFNYTCTQNDILTSEKLGWLNTLLSRAEEVLEDTLKVIPTDASATFNGNQCGIDPGVDVEGMGYPSNTDLVIFVTARPIGSANVLAFASACSYDPITDRATAGHLNYSPASLKVGENEQLQIGTSIHEITHILGFSSSRYSSFRAKLGNGSFDFTNERPLAEIQGKATWAGASRDIIITEKVVDFVQRHFEGAGLNGAELEDGGGSGTALSHWEKRSYFNEYMTGSASQDPVFSELTLALLEDSGWYSPNYDMAQTLVWGRKRGDNFVKESCDRTGWPKDSTYPGYYCTDHGAKSCAFDLRSFAVCNIIEYSPAPPENFRYFNGSNRGGLSSLADYCPYYASLPDEFCTDESRKNKDGERFCPTCRCFTTAETSLNLLDSSPTYGCFDVACYNNQDLRINVADRWYKCKASEKIGAVSRSGEINCPKQEVINSVCADSPDTSADWPDITSISPTEGEPGATIEIRGKNFKPNCTVEFHGMKCATLEQKSEELLVCKMSEGEHFKNPLHPLVERVTVMVENIFLDMDGKIVKKRGDSLTNAFKVTIPFDETFFLNLVDWGRNNPLMAALLGCSVVVAIVCCIYCCCSGDKDENQEDASHRHSQLYRQIELSFILFWLANRSFVSACQCADETVWPIVPFLGRAILGCALNRRPNREEIFGVECSAYLFVTCRFVVCILVVYAFIMAAFTRMMWL